MKKLIPNLYNKTNYVVHYRNIQFYIEQGLVLKKIHKVLSFTQRRWLKPWIDLCTPNVRTQPLNLSRILLSYKPTVPLARPWKMLETARIFAS